MFKNILFLNEKNTLPISVKNPDAYDVKDRYELSKLQALKAKAILGQYFKYYAQKWPARLKIFEVLKHLQAQGKEVNIITARALVMNTFFGSMSRRWFEEWLETYDFNPANIIYCPEKGSAPVKAQACEDLNCDIMIEDKNENIDEILNVCDVASIITSHNLNYRPEANKYDYYACSNELQLIDIVSDIDRKVRGK